MILDCLSKNKTIIIAIFSFALGVLSYNFYPVVFQEGNPYPLIKGVVQLNLSNKDIIKLSEFDGKYLTKSKDGQNIIDNFLKKQGYEFIEQLGSGYLYRSFDGDLVVTKRQYSRFFAVWIITENKKLVD